MARILPWGANLYKLKCQRTVTYLFVSTIPASTRRRLGLQITFIQHFFLPHTCVLSGPKHFSTVNDMRLPVHSVVPLLSQMSRKAIAEFLSQWGGMAQAFFILLVQESWEIHDNRTTSRDRWGCIQVMRSICKQRVFDAEVVSNNKFVTVLWYSSVYGFTSEHSVRIASANKLAQVIFCLYVLATQFRQVVLWR